MNLSYSKIFCTCTLFSFKKHLSASTYKCLKREYLREHVRLHIWKEERFTVISSPSLCIHIDTDDYYWNVKTNTKYDWKLLELFCHLKLPLKMFYFDSKQGNILMGSFDPKALWNCSTDKEISFVIFLQYTAQKMKFSIKELFSKCDQIRSFLRIWSH